MSALPSKFVRRSIRVSKTLSLPFQIRHQQAEPLVYPQPVLPPLELWPSLTSASSLNPSVFWVSRIVVSAPVPSWAPIKISTSLLYHVLAPSVRFSNCLMYLKIKLRSIPFLIKKPASPTNQFQSPAWSRSGERAPRVRCGLRVSPNKGRYKPGNKTDWKGYQYGYHVLSFPLSFLLRYRLYCKKCATGDSKKNTWNFN